MLNTDQLKYDQNIILRNILSLCERKKGKYGIAWFHNRRTVFVQTDLSFIIDYDFWSYFSKSFNLKYDDHIRMYREVLKEYSIINIKIDHDYPF